eukprot:TRINITY_DN3413_c0_g1_i1.p1 TRINITY_DN3413_c0_g1~~TRINITY_DN3413_c0_g1_i1.p1  ORF type:complete len:196 (+),score=55.42 TRINITY_DN3413_c0_g1_i1:118-705(+)
MAQPSPHHIFRAARERDLELLKELNDKLFPVKYSDQFYKDLLNPDYRSVLAFSRASGALVGAATAFLELTDEEKKYGIHGGPTAYIMTLGVSVEFRGLGLGKQLLDAIVERSEEASVFTLHVKVGNQAALRMYRRFGFQVTEELPAHYTIDGEKYDALGLVYQKPSMWVELLSDSISWLGTRLGMCWKTEPTRPY